MATLMSADEAATRQEPLDSESVIKALEPWQRRFSLQQILRWTLGGVSIGLFLACVVLLCARLIPWPSALIWSLCIASACTLLALAIALWKRPSLAQTARRIDTRLALHDRLSTAWELRTQTATLAGLQRRDALKQLQKHKPARTLSLRPQRVTILLFTTITLTFVLLLVLPNPMTALLKQQAAFQARMARQSAAIDKVRQDLTQQAAISPTEQQKIDQILRDLEGKLQQAKNDVEAQQAIAQAQAKLNQLSDPQDMNKAQANAAASSALQSSNNANLKGLGNALASNDSKQVSNALAKLTSQMNQMSAQQRSQLAQQLENAANQANQDPSLSTALHQLAKAIADGSQSEVADAARAVQAAAAQSATAQQQNNAINQVTQGLQQAANSIAASTDGSNTQNASQEQNQNPQGQDQQGQTPQGQGQQGQGQSPGSPQQGQGQQGQGQGNNNTGSNNGSNNAQSKNEQVTVPGQTTSGGSIQSNDNNTGIVQPGSSVPYSQVITQYDQMAHDAIDNSNVSPDMKDLVHNYFNSLEGQ